MNTNSAFIGCFSEKPFWYQQFDLKQIRITRRRTADCRVWYCWQLPPLCYNCRLHVTSMKAMNFHDDIPSVPIDDFKVHYMLVFDLNSKQDAAENCHYPELVGEPLRLELMCTRPLENVTEFIVMGERMSSLAVEKLGVVGVHKECVKMDKFALQQIINPIALLKFRHLGSFPSDYVPTHDNITFANINTQPINLQGEHWIMNATSRGELYFADFLGCKGYSFFNNQHYKQIMPAPLQSHPALMYAAFIGFMQLCISSRFDRKNLQGLIMLIC